MTNRLTGKTTLITGGATGLGLAIAERFVEEGAQVIITDINETAGRQAADRHGIRFEKHDVSNESQWAELFRTFDNEGVRLTTLINNAGIAEPGGLPFEDIDIENTKRVFDINFNGTVLGAKYAVGQMKETGGSIINLSSIVGMVPSPICPSYGASKAAVRHLTQSIALYCTQQGYPIRCNSIHPGQVDTSMLQEAIRTTGQEQGITQEESVAMFQGMIPMGEFSQSLDIANAALFLASEESRHVTGDRIMVDGGMLLTN